jgi:hypothetical protein
MHLEPEMSKTHPNRWHSHVSGAAQIPFSHPLEMFKKLIKFNMRHVCKMFGQNELLFSHIDIMLCNKVKLIYEL